MKCEVCGRNAKSRLCEFHERAHANLLRKFDAWKKAKDISWADYLKEMQRNPLAGLWVKELAQSLLASSRLRKESAVGG